MTKKLAFVTQSYKADFRECALLCKSFDKFVPSNIDHFIFVNDEDYSLFKTLEYGRHFLFKKSTILPPFFVRLPMRVLGHHYHLSPFTIPVREWIAQQVCKLGVFEVIGDDYDAVFNIDSESIFMRELDIKKIYRDGQYILYKSTNQCEPNFGEYCSAAKKLLGLTEPIETLSLYNYMSTPVCFERKSLQSMLRCIKHNSLLKSWKLALCNTYRFSENYLYGIYNTFCLNEEAHFITDKYMFPLIHINECDGEGELLKRVKDKLSDKDILGVLLQKTNRKKMEGKYLDFDIVCKVVSEIWEEQE